jgi:hypothetical protein
MHFDNDETPNKYITFFQEKKRGSHDEINFDIKKFYHDIKHVRKVPLKELIEKLDAGCSGQTAAARDLILYNFKNHQANLPDQSYIAFGSKPTLQHPDKQTPLEYETDGQLRKITKMHWLIHELQREELRDPPLVILNHGHATTAQFHPGGCRSAASFMLDQNPDCIVYDLFYEFADYPKIGWEEIKEMYKGPRNLSVDWHRYLSYGIPDIANQHEESKLMSLDNDIVEWSEKSSIMFDQPLRIFIGYDSTHGDCSEVCARSILQQFSEIHGVDVEKAENYFQINRIDISKIPEYTREYAEQSTEFTYSRFLVPYLSNYEGISVFVDDDFVFKNSILDLFYFVSPDSPVACVKHDFKESKTEKMGGLKNTSYDKKLWSSMMVFNNAHPDCKKLTPDIINTCDGQYLHQFKWASSVDAIPNKYVWTEGYSDITDIERSHSVHYTHGGPWIDGMEVSDIEGLVFYYQAALGGSKKINWGEVSYLNHKNYILDDVPE